MPRKVIDLSMLCSNDTGGFEITLQQNLPVYVGHECYAYDLQIKSHCGTYYETSSHVFRGAKDTEDVRPEELIMPGACLRVNIEPRCITAKDLEAAGGDKLKPGCALFIYVSDTTKYFSRDAAQWMAERKVKLMASDAPRYDSGFENPTGFFIDLFKAEIPIVGNPVNLDLLPQTGFTVIVMPLRIAGICTVPCRVIAVIDE
jgi:kynurenine formamidase